LAIAKRWAQKVMFDDQVTKKGGRSLEEEEAQRLD